MTLRTLAALLVLAVFLPGCPPRNSSYEPAFPETASNSIGPVGP